MRISSNRVLLPLVIVSMSMISCSTLLSPTTHRVSIKTNPDGAIVKVAGVDQCITPCTIDYPRKGGLKNDMVSISKDGYKEQQFFLERKTNPYFWINALDLFVLAWVDLITGAAYMPRYKDYEKTLEPLKE